MSFKTMGILNRHVNTCLNMIRPLTEPTIKDSKEYKIYYKKQMGKFHEKIGNLSNEISKYINKMAYYGYAHSGQ